MSGNNQSERGENMKLSVVITLYNKEPYLRDLFESLLRQGMKDGEYEVILVNDGSTDGTESICREFIAQHPNLNVKYKYQVNQGVSVARNVGIEMAEGEYIHFLDCDDYMLDNSYSYILSRWGNQGFDYIGFGLRMVDLRNGEESRIDTQLSSGHEIEQLSGFRLIVETRWPSSSVAGLYRTSFLKSNDICFPSGIIVGEDVWFNSDFFIKSPSCVLTSCRPYVYKFHSGSTMNTLSSLRAEKWFSSYYSLFVHLVDYKRNTPPCKDSEGISKGIGKVVNHHISVFIPKALRFRIPAERFNYWAEKFVQARIIPAPSKGLSIKVANYVFQHPHTYPFLSWCCVNIFYRFIYNWFHK